MFRITTSRTLRALKLRTSIPSSSRINDCNALSLARWSPIRAFTATPHLPAIARTKDPDFPSPTQIWSRIFTPEPDPDADPVRRGAKTAGLILCASRGIRIFPVLSEYRQSPQLNHGFMSLIAVSRCPGGAEEAEYVCAVEQLVREVAIRMLGPLPERGGDTARGFWERAVGYKACRDAVERELRAPVALGLALGMLKVAGATAWKLRLPGAEVKKEEVGCEEWFGQMRREVQEGLEKEERRTA